MLSSSQKRLKRVTHWLTESVNHDPLVNSPWPHADALRLKNRTVQVFKINVINTAWNNSYSILI